MKKIQFKGTLIEVGRIEMHGEIPTVGIKIDQGGRELLFEMGTNEVRDMAPNLFKQVVITVEVVE